MFIKTFTDVTQKLTEMVHFVDIVSRLKCKIISILYLKEVTLARNKSCHAMKDLMQKLNGKVHIRFTESPFHCI